MGDFNVYFTVRNDIIQRNGVNDACVSAMCKSLLVIPATGLDLSSFAQLWELL